MTPPPDTGPPFRYDGFELDPATATVWCRYSAGPYAFTERFTFEPGGDWEAPAVAAAARALFLLAGVSYYKALAPPAVVLAVPTTAAERSFLRTFYLRGLGEFAHRNGLDLSGLAVEGPDTAAPDPAPAAEPRRPLVPFGGGIDSIVTAEEVRARHPDTALLVVGHGAGRFAAIEEPAARTGLPVRRVTRALDPQVLRSAEHGFWNGHVPVTGILSAAAVTAAALEGRGAVVMANERSASAPTTAGPAGPVNHQWSKSDEFETAFPHHLAGTGQVLPDYFSLLRPYSELWVARRFAGLPRYLHHFRSCNRAFTVDPARRLDHWCGRCDKCCFIDLVLAPFVPAAELKGVFGGAEPLDDPGLAPQFEALLDVGAGAKPFECVGDADECRAAALLAAGRPDRAGHRLLGALAGAAAGAGTTPAAAAALLARAGAHHIPDGYLPDDPPPDPLD